MLALPNGKSGARGLVWFVELLTIWPSFAVTVKRLHDRVQSGWLALLNVVPLLVAYALLKVNKLLAALAFIVWCVSALWLLVETGSRAGTSGPNPFGPEPV